MSESTAPGCNSGALRFELDSYLIFRDDEKIFVHSAAGRYLFKHEDTKLNNT